MISKFKEGYSFEILNGISSKLKQTLDYEKPINTPNYPILDFKILKFKFII